MDVSDIASYYIKRKIENKGSQMGHTKKIFKKKFRVSTGLSLTIHRTSKH
jgi:hypothetical protein